MKENKIIVAGIGVPVVRKILLQLLISALKDQMW